MSEGHEQEAKLYVLSEPVRFVSWAGMDKGTILLRDTEPRVAVFGRGGPPLTPTEVGALFDVLDELDKGA